MEFMPVLALDVVAWVFSTARKPLVLQPGVEALEFGSVVAAQLANFEPMFEDNVLIECLECLGHFCLVAKEINKYRPRVLVDKVDGISIAPSNIGLANGHQVRVHHLKGVGGRSALAACADVGARGLSLRADRAALGLGQQ